MKYYINKNEIENNNDAKDYIIYLSDLDSGFKDIAERLLKEKLESRIYKAEI